MKLDKDAIIHNARESLNSIKAFAKNAAQKIKAAINSDKKKDSDEEKADTPQDETIETQDQNSTNAKSDTTSATKETAAASHQKPSSIGLAITLSLLDIIASLVFIAAIVIAIKPGILAGKLNAPSASYHAIFEKIGNTLMKIETTMVSRPSPGQAFFVGLGLVIYGLLKVFVLLSAKNGTRKTVSILTLIMTYFACFMVSDKFLLFTIFILLLYFTFSYSCGFSTPAVLVKLAVVIVAAIAIYVAVHFALDSVLAREASNVMNKLSLPIKRWW